VGFLAGSTGRACNPWSWSCEFEHHAGCRDYLKIKSWKKIILAVKSIWQFLIALECHSLAWRLFQPVAIFLPSQVPSFPSPSSHHPAGRHCGHHPSGNHGQQQQHGVCVIPQVFVCGLQLTANSFLSSCYFRQMRWLQEIYLMHFLWKSLSFMVESTLFLLGSLTLFFFFSK